MLPSATYETWGLVVNEAMNFGLPVVVSDRVGCGKDLVRDGWNGYTFAHADAQQLSYCLARLAESAALRAEFGANSANLVHDYSVEACCEGIVGAACSAGGAGR